jgi:hypothetical protein
MCLVKQLAPLPPQRSNSAPPPGGGAHFENLCVIQVDDLA